LFFSPVKCILQLQFAGEVLRALSELARCSSFHQSFLLFAERQQRKAAERLLLLPIHSHQCCSRSSRQIKPIDKEKMMFVDVSLKISSVIREP
jgi:hypothetical protein